MLLYIHTEFKSSFDSMLAELNKRLLTIETSLDKSIYTTSLKTEYLEKEMVSLKDTLDKHTQSIFFLDRFMAKAEVQMSLSRERAIK